MPSELTPSALRAFVADLLAEAAPYAAEQFGRTGPLRYKYGHQAVTAVDRELEDRVAQRILDVHPDHFIDGEEAGPRGSAQAPWRWHLDPIDGTFNYSLGIPCFSISLAVSHRGEMVAGGVIDPLSGELFTAGAGEGAFLGAQPITVSDRSPLSEAVASIQVSRGGLFLREQALLGELNVAVMKSRRLGTIALELAYVACGRFDLLVAGKVTPQNLYDVGAGVLLVAEAGGRVSDGAGNRFTGDSIEMVASNGHVHQDVLDLMQPYLAAPKAADR